MNQQGQVRPRQASPLSMESTDSSFLGRYQAMSPGLDNPYANIPAVPNSQRSPPLSHNPSTSTDNSRPTSNRTPSNGNHSSTSSVAKSSDGNGLHSPVMSEGGRSHSSRQEEALSEHYHVLRNYLAPHLANDSGARPTRARDKLLRLSPTQFLELSTDVYDELLRRQDFLQRGGDIVPRSLPPKTTFHPKRNQARQKLSTLPPERFRQLATDVYYELERRVPRLGGGDNDRSASPAFSTASSQRGPGRPQPQGYRGPGGPPGPPSAYRSPPSGGNQPFPPRSGSNGEYGRPLPKTFQSNTIVPNKSTMVEDDETDEEDDPMGIDSVVNGLTKRSTSKSNGSESETLKAYEAQILELQDKLAGMEDTLQSKDAEIERLETSHRERETGFGSERDGWIRARGDLERRVAELTGSTDAHNAAMDRTHENYAKREASLREQTEQQMTDLQSQLDMVNQENTMLRLQGGPSERGPSDGELQQRCQTLERRLVEQQKTTDEVRQNATEFLQEMRLLSQQSDAALEKEEQLRSQISSLQVEVDEWKHRYTKTRTLLRTLHASSIGLSLQNMADKALSSRQEYLSQNGVVSDMDVTSFQISIDELLTTARRGAAEETLNKMKAVVHNVQQMTGGESGNDYNGVLSPATSPNPQSPPLNGNPPTVSSLTTRVTRNAKGLITATRNFVSSNGLSPVSLVDAAAANLTAAVVDYLKTVGIKPTSGDHLRHDAEDVESYETLAPRTHDPLNPVKVNEAPKMNRGWHNRLKGSFDSTYSQDNGATAPHDDDDDEYNSYR
ncbi:hypothetical protein MBLNU457_4933t1 [Dothideomycetes sp. NU457]